MTTLVPINSNILIIHFHYQMTGSVPPTCFLLKLGPVRDRKYAFLLQLFSLMCPPTPVRTIKLNPGEDFT